MPPEAKTNGFTVNQLDNQDVYTLGVCLYKMLIGLNSQVKHFEFKLELLNDQKNVSYSTFQNLLTKMLEYNPLKSPDDEDVIDLDNIFYQQINGEYVAKIADYGVIKLNYGTLTFDFNKKIDFMPPEAKTDKGTGKYLDNLDVYTLGVCLYKMLFGQTSQVQYIDKKIDLPKESKEDSYCALLDLIYKMLEYDFTKRKGWQELYSLLYQFPQILSTKGRDDDDVSNYQLYLTDRLEQHYISKLLDPQIKVTALSFQQLLRTLKVPEQQLMTITVMKYTFQQQMQLSTTLTEEQFDGKILELRSANYLANIAVQVEWTFVERGRKFVQILSDIEEQYIILKRIKRTKNLEPCFQKYIRNKLQKSFFNIF